MVTQRLTCDNNRIHTDTVLYSPCQSTRQWMMQYSFLYAYIVLQCHVLHRTPSIRNHTSTLKSKNGISYRRSRVVEYLIMEHPLVKIIIQPQLSSHHKAPTFRYLCLLLSWCHEDADMRPTMRPLTECVHAYVSCFADFCQYSPCLTQNLEQLQSVPQMTSS